MFFKPIRLVLLFCLAVAFSAGTRADSELEPGEYILRQGPWHTLTVKHQADGSANFSIASMVVSRYACYVGGKLSGNRAVITPNDATSAPCNVFFAPRSEGIEVTSEDNDTCRSFCAHISSFDGLYSSPKKGCRPSDVAVKRARFRELYAGKAYKQALDALQPLLRNCESDIWYDDMTWMRNDLAVTNYHLGDHQSCREILAPLEGDARTWEGVDETKIRGDQHRILPMMKTTLFNLKLCGANSR